MANLEGEESFDPSNLGTAEVVSQERVSDQELILIKVSPTKLFLLSFIDLWNIAYLFILYSFVVVVL
jgi:hypothetical protein